MKRRLIITGLLLLVFASGGLVWLGGTEAGLKWVYGQATQHIPGKLQVSSLSGRLIGPIEITDIRYRLENQSIEIRQASFDWNLRELPHGEFEIERVYLEGMQIEIYQSEASSAQGPSAVTIPEIALPVAIDLQDFKIDDIRIIHGDKTTLIERLHTRLLLDRQQLRIENLSLESEQLQLNLSAKLEPSPELPHEIDLNWRARLNPTETLQGKGRLSGNLSRTRLTQSIAGAI